MADKINDEISLLEIFRDIAEAKENFAGPNDSVAKVWRKKFERKIGELRKKQKTEHNHTVGAA